MLWMQFPRLDDCIARFNRGDIDGIGITEAVKFGSTDLSFITECRDPRGLVLPYAKRYDISLIHTLRSLRLLCVSDSRAPLDCQQFPLLEDLSIEWHKRITLPADGAPLKYLDMAKYKGCTDLSILAEYPNLSELHLVQGSLRSLDGAERFTSLTRVDLAYMPKLASVGALRHLPVEFLSIQNCPNIEDLAALAQCPRLRALRLNTCGTLPSLKFLNDFPRLEEFRFVDTNVLDGDLTPLLRLKSIGSMSKRHYRPSVEEVKRRIGDTSP